MADKIFLRVGAWYRASEKQIPEDIDMDDIIGSTSDRFPEIEVNAGVRTIDVYARLGSVIKGQTAGVSIFNVSTTGGATSGTLYLGLADLPTSGIITGVKWWHGTTGVYTESDYNGWGVYTLNEATGDLTLVAFTPNDGNIWKPTTLTWRSKAFASTYAVSESVIYYVGMLYNTSAQTTAPSLGRCLAMQSVNISTVDFPNSIKLFGFVTGQTALPTSINMSAVTSNSAIVYFAFY